jgi:hypothetical protein
MSQPPLVLLPRTTCPHCWQTFLPEEVLWISAHQDLLGDPRLGPEQPQRFLPSRFDLDGNALDARGFSCRQLACPRCHLVLPRCLLETEPAFVSILGTPACGKSFYLTALTWELRRLLPERFALGFTDADPSANRQLNDYESALFLNANPHEFTYLADLIRKTELQGYLYDIVSYGSQTVTYPRPFLFLIKPRPTHPQLDVAQKSARVICLYDNAGESFQPGRDTAASPVTQHLARAQFLLFLYDPTQDLRFRQLCDRQGVRLPHESESRNSRQELVLMEAADRVRRTVGLSANARHERPLIVVLTKSDLWGDLLEDREPKNPWVTTRHGTGLDRGKVERRSDQARVLLWQACPELVTAAEDFAQEVVYVPVSALGVLPRRGEKGPAVRPADLKPRWATVPLLYGLSRWVPGLVPGVKRASHKETGDTRLPETRNTQPG